MDAHRSGVGVGVGVGVAMISRPRRRTPAPTPWSGVIVARAVSQDPPAAGLSGKQKRRAAVNKIGNVLLSLVLMTLTVGITTMSGSGGTAHAEVSPCIDDPTYNTWGPESVRSGIDGMIAQSGPKGTYDTATDPLPRNSYPTVDAAIADTNYTDYEKLGTAGATWGVDYGSQDEDDNPCFPIDKVIGNFVANLTFNMAKLVTRVSISTYQWASGPGVLEPLNEPLDDTVDAMWSGGVKGMVAVMIVLGALSVLYVTVVRRRASAGLGGIVWMVIALAGLMLFVVKPSAVATAADGLVRDATSFAMSSAASATEQKDPHVQETYDKVRQSEGAGPRIAADMMWRLLVFTPWMSGQYGDVTGEPIYMQTSPQPDDTPPGWYDGTRDARYQQLYSQACVLSPGVPCEQYDNTPNAPDISPYYGYAQSWYMVQNWTCTSADYCIGPQGNPDGGDDDDEREVISSNGWQYRAVWSGDQSGQRMLAAFTAGVADAALGLLIFIFAAMTIAFSLVMYVLLFLGPFLLLIGIEPKYGRRLVTQLGGFLAGTVLKRIGVGLLLSVMIVVFQIVMMTPMSWFSQIGLMVAFAVAALMIRGPLSAVLASFAPNAGSLSGVGDSAHEKVTQKSRQGVDAGRRVGQKAIKSPAAQRRAFMASRAATTAARSRIGGARRAGQEVSGRQEKRTLRSARYAGYKTGKSADDRYEAQRHGTTSGDRVAKTRLDLAEQKGVRRFSKTEHGKAAQQAEKVRETAAAGRAKHDRLKRADEDVRIAAAANPKRFRGTPRNFDGYDAGGEPQYVDRNSRGKPSQQRHGRRIASNVPLRGADPLPRPERRRPTKTPVDTPTRAGRR